MYAGAALGAFSGIYYGVTASPASAPQFVHGVNPHSSAYAVGFVLGAGIFGAVIAGVWLWMAWAVRRGKHWARVVSAVLLAVGTLRMLVALVVSPLNPVSIAWTLSWLAGLGAVIMLFLPGANAFFLPRAAVPPPGYPPGPAYPPAPGYPPATGYQPGPGFPPGPGNPSYPGSP